MNPALQLFGAGREKRNLRKSRSIPRSRASISPTIRSPSSAGTSAARSVAPAILFSTRSSPTTAAQPHLRVLGHRLLQRPARRTGGGMTALVLADVAAKLGRAAAPPGRGAVQIVRHAGRLSRRLLRAAVAGEVLGGRRRIRLGQDDAAQLCLGPPAAGMPEASVFRLRERQDRRAFRAVGTDAPHADADRLGIVHQNPRDGLRLGRLGRRQCRRAPDGRRRPPTTARFAPRPATGLARSRSDVRAARRLPIRPSPAACSSVLQIARNLVSAAPPRLHGQSRPAVSTFPVQARLLDLLRGLLRRAQSRGPSW